MNGNQPNTSEARAIIGAKTAHGEKRPPYLTNPDRSRDPPSDGELAVLDAGHWVNGGSRSYGKARHTPRIPGSKIWRKAREGKL